jgi:16S rRNA (uracil1498-N3)-methyltransferase
MSAPRFFLPHALAPDAVGSELALPDAPAHHALRVLRLAVGDPLTLFTGAGGEFAATLVRADKRSAWVRIDGFDPVAREAPIAITLVQGIAAGDAMDQVVRRAVELGAAAIQPVHTAHGARVAAGARTESRLAHWRQIAQAACEQCGRNHIPPIHEIVELREWLAQRSGAHTGIVLAPDAARSIAALPVPAHGVEVTIGPEGGLRADEVEAAARAGLVPVRMGPRIMRTETAAAAALAAINTLWGDFG